MLVRCSECGRKISSKAAACPQCGAPNVAPARDDDYRADNQSDITQARIEHKNNPKPRSRFGRTVFTVLLAIIVPIVGFVMLAAVIAENSPHAASGADQASSDAKPTVAVVAKQKPSADDDAAANPRNPVPDFTKPFYSRTGAVLCYTKDSLEEWIKHVEAGLPVSPTDYGCAQIPAGNQLTYLGGGGFWNNEIQVSQREDDGTYLDVWTLWWMMRN